MVPLTPFDGTMLRFPCIASICSAWSTFVSWNCTVKVSCAPEPCSGRTAAGGGSTLGFSAASCAAATAAVSAKASDAPAQRIGRRMDRMCVCMVVFPLTTRSPLDAACGADFEPIAFGWTRFGFTAWLPRPSARA